MWHAPHCRHFTLLLQLAKLAALGIPTVVPPVPKISAQAPLAYPETHCNGVSLDWLRLHKVVRGAQQVWEQGGGGGAVCVANHAVKAWR